MFPSTHPLLKRCDDKRRTCMPSVGKNELLAWLGTESGQPCRSLEDLKSGTIVLATLARIFPRLAERRYRVKWRPKFDWEHGLNWESIAQMCQTLKLPTELIDRGGLQVSTRHRSRATSLDSMLCAAHAHEDPTSRMERPREALTASLYAPRSTPRGRTKPTNPQARNCVRCLLM